MGLALPIFLVVLFPVVFSKTTTPHNNISLGSSLNPLTNPSWRSPSGLFAFGFYHQGGGFAVGIWLESRPEITVVWTANPDDPPVSSNSTIEFNENGWLVLRTSHGEGKNITNGQPLDSATSASMLDSGNFVLVRHSLVIWESFAYPCDTILGGQNLTRGNQLVSIVSASQHSRGRFVLKMQWDGNLVAYPRNSSQWQGDAYWASMTVNSGVQLSLYNTGSLYVLGDGVNVSLFNSSQSSLSRKGATVIFRATLNPDGNFVLYSHVFTSPSTNSTGMTLWSAIHDPCKAKGACGFNSYCSNTVTGDADCHCFPGFLFINNTTSAKFLGCYRNFSDEQVCSRTSVKLSYNITDLDNIDLGGDPYSVMNLTKKACRKSCFDDCNCWASLYADPTCKMFKFPLVYSRLSKIVSSTLFIKTSVGYP